MSHCVIKACKSLASHATSDLRLCPAATRMALMASPEAPARQTRKSSRAAHLRCRHLRRTLHQSHGDIMFNRPPTHEIYDRAASPVLSSHTGEKPFLLLTAPSFWLVDKYGTCRSKRLNQIGNDRTKANGKANASEL